MADEIQAFGLVATKSIAKGASRAPLDLLAGNGRDLVYNAWTNEPWIVEGAAVRVSIVCAANTERRQHLETKLNGSSVQRINPDLTTGTDVTTARRLSENSGVAFQGVKLTGPFDIAGHEARELLKAPLNPNGRPNADVVARLYDIDDIVGRVSDRWVIDFGYELTEAQAMLYEGPFRIVAERVTPFRRNPEKCRSPENRLFVKYWEFQRPRPKMRKALASKHRFIITPESSEHRIFIFAPARVLIQGSLFAIAREDDVTFGILSSRIHEIWATAQGNRLGAGNQRRYNKDVAFETFPFPDGLSLAKYGTYHSDARAKAIARAASHLNDLREAWLNPTNLVKRDGEVVATFPERILPINSDAELQLRKRTLTDLYNERPAWLAQLHLQLDEAVAEAYGWPVELSSEEILCRLMVLNQSRYAAASGHLSEQDTTAEADD